MSATVASKIQTKIEQAFAPQYLEVLNESNRHHVPPNSETHFKLVIVSGEFEGQRLLSRHRSVNSLLADELANGVHALAMHTYTPTEWAEQGSAPMSPNCKG
ncbi:BolA/IbaG family iron-sulfur metabolism protein [Shewanella sp. SNU WT4]|uniref:BolA family protein n=1 Tax=Shewanella sp. SNU WT4 TaxID=2590015 RepID=UPI0011295646|nr:BolA/IbaG family iron-sulfur metabolism protein [Shewanella sp. SNU WT4]QDF67895.1 BolA/IbaG family iron-sulfur metabolism protein [Shewanella sp. SNU WT4]